MSEPAFDTALRLAAVEQVTRASSGGIFSSDVLLAGFQFQGQRVPLVNPQRGIFKPAAMSKLLSVRTVFPKSGRKIWYDDQRTVHEQIMRGDELVDYAFMGDNPDASDNRWLREVWEDQTPILYFLGVAPAKYTLLWPTYVAEWLPQELKVRLAFGMASQANEAQRHLPEARERRYSLRLVRQRLHQATFREAVLAAYGNRCAISGLPEPRLLDAAHILADGHEEFGQPVVQNGLTLSKVHHAAFDANLIGVDADFRIHVSDALMSLTDGPMLELGLKAMAGQQLKLPTRAKDHPDRDRLAMRFETFKKIAA